MKVNKYLVEFIRNNTVPLPYTINWSTVENIRDVAQVVDGFWVLQADGIRTGQTGYDRLVAIGDVNQDDYITPIVNNTSPWQLSTNFGLYVAQLPLLLICLIGVVLILVYRRRKPIVTRLTLVAMGLVVVETLVGTYLNLELPFILQGQGWGTHAIGVALVSSQGFQSLTMAVSLGLLYLAIFRGQTR